ncbi:4-hydroxy-tetrahydrodipicolinate reductase [Candidatus Erwinia haradaeae]|uniref:4-hydroxy-tetrahydrodipicolinate reductase n=1 Tax=Candidatus Erwinia haradaeae TaxID=1922217 RepID=A0A451DA37_9GAMM|nr:4-hydroxy-tetrahydrodipicolinate reductase [Candidatus Erwinia haradaeae]VFP83192.1 4-hydroxy-tetrahydrodipicolinate reductase [Candidatus Erwinia haradaeae]
MKKTIRVAITGTDGRMGRKLIKATMHIPEIILGAAIVNTNSLLIGSDAGELVGSGITGIKITDQVDQVADSFDVLIDFTRPQGTLKYLALCKKYKKAMIIGTTGFNTTEYDIIQNTAKDIAIVCSSNFSIGATIMLKLAGQAAKMIGEHADIDILETHHREKIDSPSGTALVIGEAIARAMHWDFNQHAIYSSDQSVAPRLQQKIKFTSIRCGDTVGEHTALFSDIGEYVKISHKVSTRMAFAKGALKSALWVKNHKTGYFNMLDILNWHHI